MGKNKESASLINKYSKMVMSEQISPKVRNIDYNTINEKKLYMKPDRYFTSKMGTNATSQGKLPESMAENIHKAQKFLDIKNDENKLSKLKLKIPKKLRMSSHFQKMKKLNDNMSKKELRKTLSKITW